MTTPQAKTKPTEEQWEPYPHLEKEEKDMQQRPVEKDLDLKLGAALTPGRHYPYHPDILIGSEIPIYYGERDPVTRRFPNVRPDILIALDVDAEAIWRRVGLRPDTEWQAAGRGGGDRLAQHPPQRLWAA